MNLPAKARNRRSVNGNSVGKGSLQLLLNNGNIFLSAENIAESQTDEFHILLGDILHHFFPGVFHACSFPTSVSYGCRSVPVHFLPLSLLKFGQARKKESWTAFSDRIHPTPDFSTGEPDPIPKSSKKALGSLNKERRRFRHKGALCGMDAFAHPFPIIAFVFPHVKTYLCNNC